MSPTESDLRAALREGEGGGPDIDRLVAGVRARQARSRRTLLGAAAAVLVVCGAGAGSAVLWGGASNSGSESKAAAGADRNQVNNGSAAHRAAGGAPTREPVMAAPAAAAPAVACPAAPPRPLVPGGGRPGQFDAQAPLFRRPVKAVVVCAYGSPDTYSGLNAGPGRLVLTGPAATELAASLEHAATARTPRACPNIATSGPRALALIGVDRDGRPAGTVATTLVVPACNVEVSNGTAVRYQWSPPADLQGVLVGLAPIIGPSDGDSTPSGRMYPSPIKT